MTIHKNVSLRMKLILTMGLMMIVLASAINVASYRQYERAIRHHVEHDNHTGIRVLVQHLIDRFDTLTYDLSGDGEISDVTWAAFPAAFDADLTDQIRYLTGMHATVFRFDPASGNFVRMATTARDADENRMVGTNLANVDAAAALRAGTEFSDLIDGRTREIFARYQPVFGPDGSVIGAIAVGRAADDYRALLSEVFLGALAVALPVLAVMLALGLFIIRRMLAPLGDMATAIVALSKGELDTEVRYSDRKEEIGEISNGLLVLRESMRDAERLQAAEAERLERDAVKQREQALVVNALTDGLARLSDLDLTARIERTSDAPFPADYESLRASFNSLVDSLSDSITDISASAEEVTSEARDLAGSATDLSDRTESQAATLQQSAAALEELSESVQSTAENAADAEATTNENRTAAKHTGEVVENAISAMEAIEASSKQITQIISVIEDIAFQTNLLALNAGVEAARAGEAGRGFAVVASEVRALAQHSSASAQEIKSLIAASSQQVETGSTLVRDAGKALNDIISRVDRVAGLVSDIAVSATQQSVGVSEINAGVRDLDAATQRNAVMAEEASAATEGLTNAAERMTGRLARFKLNTGGTAPSPRSVVKMPSRPRPARAASAADLQPEPTDAFNGF